MELTRDAFLGGRLRLLQPARGQRAGSDAALLAAAVPARPGERVAELGAGCGPALLALAARVPGVHCLGLEIDRDLVDLANRNACENGLGERVRFVAGDVADPPPDLSPAGFDHVMMNPPFFDEARSRVSPDPARARARSAGPGANAVWIGAARRLLRPGGWLAMIHRCERETELLALLDEGFGEVRLLALRPGGMRPERPAKRLIMLARKGGSGALCRLPDLLLHRPDGGYTDAVEAILRQARPLDLGRAAKGEAEEG